eukprot:1830754-Rhodomonas_salina.1
MALRIGYAMSGTEMAYGARAREGAGSRAPGVGGSRGRGAKSIPKPNFSSTRCTAQEAVSPCAVRFSPFGRYRWPFGRDHVTYQVLRHVWGEVLSGRGDAGKLAKLSRLGQKLMTQ